MINEEDPLCDSCNHRHVQGVKCLICGHVGRSQIFMKMQIKALEWRDYKINIFGVSPENEELWELSLATRCLVMDATCVGLNPSDSADSYDSMSRHAVGFGDAIVSCARWRWISMPPVGSQDITVSVAYIDTFCVIDMHRRAGRGKVLLMHLLHDQLQQAQAQMHGQIHGQGHVFCGTALRVPYMNIHAGASTGIDSTEWLVSKLLKYGFTMATDQLRSVLDVSSQLPQQQQQQSQQQQSQRAIYLFLSTDDIQKLLLSATTLAPVGSAATATTTGCNKY